MGGLSSIAGIAEVNGVYREPLEKIIGRAVMDLKFRRKMLEDPETAFKEYNLTREQILALKNIPTDALEKFAHRLTESAGKNSTGA